MEDIDLELYEKPDETSVEQKVGTFLYSEALLHEIDILENQEFRGRKFDPGFSCWFKFRAWIGIAKDIAPDDLDSWKHRLRLTMKAMNQEPLTATLFFDWPKTIEKPTSCFPVLPHSLAAARRDHIIGSSKGEEELDRRHFAVFDKGKPDTVKPD